MKTQRKMTLSEVLHDEAVEKRSIRVMEALNKFNNPRIYKILFELSQGYSIKNPPEHLELTPKQIRNCLRKFLSILND